jgi:hypothetical protein
MSRPAATAVAAIIFAAGFLAGASSTSRPAAQPTDLRSPRRMTMDGPAPVPSPDYAVPLAEAPIGSPVASRLTPSPSPTGKRPAATAKPRTSMHLRGVATWYAYRRGEAAAGPALRAALGPGWRGSVVWVNGVRVRLTDWMGTTNRAKVIDLDAGLFRAICGPLSLGVCKVVVAWK